MPVNWSASVSRKRWEEFFSANVLPVDLHCTACQPLSWFCANNPKQRPLYHCTWIIDLLAKQLQGTESCFVESVTGQSWLSFYGHSCKSLRVVSLLVSFFFLLLLWMRRLTDLKDVRHECPSVQLSLWRKWAVFDLWMPIERRHQLFGLYLKAEMWCVALFWFWDDSIWPFLTVNSRVSGEL